MLLWAEILRSIPLPTVSLFPENKDIANGSWQKVLLRKDHLCTSGKRFVDMVMFGS
jgi:hypothetical protein